MTTVGRLRRSNSHQPGIRRRRSGKGFTYLAVDGGRIDPDTRARIEALVLPPAWQDVWICPYPNGHIQATGVDAAGRVQYRYHDAWRQRRDVAKHARVLQVASRLPAARLLDVGFFRIGSEQYEEENGTFGLTTLGRRHVEVDDGVVRFDYIAKSGKHRLQTVADPDVLAVVEVLRRRRSGPAHLLAYQEGRRWHEVDADDVNDYLRETVGGEQPVSAKDFRTWHATVLMAVALAVGEKPATETAAKRMLARAYGEVAHYLGNTPAVCRASYVDPRIVDLWRHRRTVRAALDTLGEDASVGEPATQGAVEAAVLDLLD